MFSDVDATFTAAKTTSDDRLKTLDGVVEQFDQLLSELTNLEEIYGKQEVEVDGMEKELNETTDLPDGVVEVSVV